MKSGKKTTLLIAGGVCLLLGVMSVAGFFLWRAHSKKTRELHSLSVTKELLSSARPAEALKFIGASRAEASGAREEEWFDLEITALEQVRNIPRLLYLFEKNPEAFYNHEEASLLIGRSLLQLRDMESFAVLRKFWQPRETMPTAWFAIDVDALLAQGKGQEAREFLNSKVFEGPEDCVRLTRLALLSAADDLHQAWDLLTDCYTSDPKNSDVRLFRAQILERIGKDSMARVEYVAAHLTDPDNPLLRDQLAEFYRRSGSYGLALQTWTAGLDPPSLPFLWAKTLFWSRVAEPVSYHWSAGKAPPGPLQTFVDYLISLPRGEYWNKEAFKKISRRLRLLEERQESFWLRLLSALKRGEESEALELLRSNPFREHSWHPDLEDALRSVLTYRRWGVFPSLEEIRGSDRSQSVHIKHQLFNELQLLSNGEHELNETGETLADLDRLLTSKEAFGAIFLAAGWLEAALSFHRMAIVPDDFPDWVAYGFTQAYRLNRGNKEAIEFANKQSSFPALDLLMAELMLAEGKLSEGLERLTVLAVHDSDVGFRAAWLLCLARLDLEELDEAKRIVLVCPRLRDSVTGREVLARIAFSEGRIHEADMMYSGLEKESSEAKAYLARRAFEEQDWTTARRLTEELLQLFPDKLQLRANLEAIEREESKHDQT